MKAPDIQFAAHLNLSEQTKDDIAHWAPMQRQLRRMANAGFAVSRLVINGASFVGADPAKQKLLMTQARLFYTTPDGHDESYHVNFLPDAAALLVAFRLVNEEVSSNAATPAAPSLDEFHVVMIEQPRIAAAGWCLQVPGGMLDADRHPDLSSFERPDTGALREYNEEVGAGTLPGIRSAELVELGEPVTLHPANTDTQSQFYVVKEIGPAALETARRKVNGSTGDDPNEITRPCIIPLREALRRTTEDGGSPWSSQMLWRFAMKMGCV